MIFVSIGKSWNKSHSTLLSSTTKQLKALKCITIQHPMISSELLPKFHGSSKNFLTSKHIILLSLDIPRLSAIQMNLVILEFWVSFGIWICVQKTKKI